MEVCEGGAALVFASRRSVDPDGAVLPKPPAISALRLPGHAIATVRNGVASADASDALRRAAQPIGTPSTRLGRDQLSGSH